MNRKLFLCNTVYQIFIAMWMKHSCFPDTKSDIIISDHMKDGKKLAERIREYGEFENCYYVESLEYTSGRMPVTDEEDRYIRLLPSYFLRRFVRLKHKYSELYIANFDRFSQLLFGALIQKNKHCEVCLFEDGVGTYSKVFCRWYEDMKLPELDTMHTVIRNVFRQRGIFGNLSKVYLLTPEQMQWDPGCPLVMLEKIDQQDSKFVDMCNRVFGYYDSKDIYNEKYIFIEQCFEVDGIYLNDIAVIEELAQRVGKDNVLVKVHPRSRENRFEKVGYKTNTDVSIPWEIIMLNQKNLPDKVLLTISSGAAINPIILFGAELKAYSLIDVIKFAESTSETIVQCHKKIAYDMAAQCPENLKICQSLDDIV